MTVPSSQPTSTGSSAEPEDPADGWTVSVIVSDPTETAYGDALTHLANGFQGLRGTADPGDVHAEPSFLVTSVYADGFGVGREIVNLPHPLGWVLRRDGEALATVGPVHKELDLRRGVATVRQTMATSAGETWSVTMQTRVHATRPELGMMSMGIEGPPGAEELVVELFWDSSTGNPYLGGRVPAVRTFHVVPDAVRFAEEGVTVDGTVVGGEPMPSLASAVRCPHEHRRHRLLEKSRWGEVLVVRPDVGEVSLRLAWTVGSAAWSPADALAGWTRLVREHESEWERRWGERDIVVEGDPRSDHALRMCQFQLMQHELPARPVRLSPARGLSGSYHSGATFFDTELHKDAYWSWTDAQVARSHLAFRHSTLAAAQELARRSGFAGARFPVAADDQGRDTGPDAIMGLGGGAPVPEWNISQVVHVSADVAYAVCRYHAVTGDDEFLLAHGLELMVETARFAASVLRRPAGAHGHGVGSVMGPDEYHHHVEDSLFTNMMLRWNLDAAVRTVEHARRVDRDIAAHLCGLWGLSADELVGWQRIAADVRMPPPLENGVPAQHRGYRDLVDCALRVDDGTPAPRLTDAEREEIRTSRSLSSRLIKQADVVLLAHLLPEEFPGDAASRALDYYEPRTAHASSLSFAPHGVVAARSGDADRAREFLLRSARYNLDYVPRAHYRNGLHLSACAGAWQVVVEGLLDARPLPDGLAMRPRLPSGWTRLRVPLRFRGSRVVVTVEPHALGVRLESGPPLRVEVHDEAALLTRSSGPFRCSTFDGTHTRGDGSCA